jgi:hypothetical protein
MTRVKTKTNKRKNEWIIQFIMIPKQILDRPLDSFPQLP